MAQNNANGSNRAKHLRKLKRKNTLLLRTLKQRHQQWFNAQAALMAVLGQSGGEFTITAGTYAQTLEAFTKGELSYEAVAGKTPNETVLRLVTREAEKPVEEETPVEFGEQTLVATNDDEGGFDEEGEYHHPNISQSDVLLAEEGRPYEIIGQIARDEEENA